MNKAIKEDAENYVNNEISKHHNVETHSTLAKDNPNTTAMHGKEREDITESDVMFVDEIEVDMNLVKNEPNEDGTNTDRNKAQTSETSIMFDIKTEVASPEICSDVSNNKDIPENSVNNSEINQHNVNNHSEYIHKQIQCSFCKVYFPDKEYSEHSKCCNENISKPNANIQKRRVSNTETSSTSTAGLHSTLDIEIKNEPENGENCSGNDDSLLSKPRRKRRSKRAVSDEAGVIPCEICDATFNTSLEFALHSIVHSDDEKYHCFMCDYKNRSAYDFKIHIRVHEETKYKCEVCKEEFTDKTEADEHKYLHTGETPFECETCGKCFMFSWLLNSHRRSKHWEVLIGMPIPKYDPNAIHYKHHIYSTMDIRRHKYYKGVSAVSDRDLTVLCEICGKRLSSMERLKFHLRVHTGYKPFVCSYCAKPFSRREQLREHERVHTGERPYICRFCGKGFTQRSPLRIHERTHTGERPYQCRLCAKGYVSKGAVDIHMKTCKGT